MKNLHSLIICEECKLAINNINEGMVEWIDDDVSITDVRVIHNSKYSPNGNCYKHTQNYHRQDNHLALVLKNPELKKRLGITNLDTGGFTLQVHHI